MASRCGRSAHTKRLEKRRYRIPHYNYSVMKALNAAELGPRASLKQLLFDMKFGEVLRVVVMLVVRMRDMNTELVKLPDCART